MLQLKKLGINDLVSGGWGERGDLEGCQGGRGKGGAAHFISIPVYQSYACIPQRMYEWLMR